MNYQAVFLTPQEFKERLNTSPLEGGVLSSSYGLLAVRILEDFICALAFIDKEPLTHWIYKHSFKKNSFMSQKIDLGRQPQKLMLVGTLFQHQVWEQLLKIPFGTVKFYKDIAIALGDPNKSRAVGSAVGANPISWLVPCHRVLPRSGGVGNYHWGSKIKKNLLKDEGYAF